MRKTLAASIDISTTTSSIASTIGGGTGANAICTMRVTPGTAGPPVGMARPAELVGELLGTCAVFASQIRQKSSGLPRYA